ncbi:MAG: hypothetical protein J7J10_00210 [Deltaproteobacteria bacterium]|nr:hypothetical protein [Deltaproteobacteria bacterium]
MYGAKWIRPRKEENSEKTCNDEENQEKLANIAKTVNLTEEQAQKYKPVAEKLIPEFADRDLRLFA